MENLPIPRRAIYKVQSLDGLVHSRPVDVRPHNLVARIQLHHHVGTIIDEPRDKAIVQALPRPIPLSG